MNRYELAIGVTFVLALSTIGAICQFEWYAEWTDTGHIYQSQKTFDGSWHSYYTVVTVSHGNFTFRQQGSIDMFPCLPTIEFAPSTGELVGLAKSHYGCYTVVEDP